MTDKSKSGGRGGAQGRPIMDRLRLVFTLLANALTWRVQKKLREYLTLENAAEVVFKRGDNIENRGSVHYP